MVDPLIIGNQFIDVSTARSIRFESIYPHLTDVSDFNNNYFKVKEVTSFNSSQSVPLIKDSYYPLSNVDKLLKPTQRDR